MLAQAILPCPACIKCSLPSRLNNPVPKSESTSPSPPALLIPSPRSSRRPHRFRPHTRPHPQTRPKQSLHTRSRPHRPQLRHAHTRSWAPQAPRLPYPSHHRHAPEVERGRPPAERRRGRREQAVCASAQCALGADVSGERRERAVIGRMGAGHSGCGGQAGLAACGPKGADTGCTAVEGGEAGRDGGSGTGRSGYGNGGGCLARCLADRGHGWTVEARAGA